MIVYALLAAASLSAADQAAVFTAAGITKRGSQWHSDCADPGTDSYTPGAIELVRDLNGDGHPEIVVTEGGSFCYGEAGTGFWLVTKQANGRWLKLLQSQGMAEFLATRGVGNMPDIAIGGPGFCFPVVRWNGKTYVNNRFEYEGKRCRP
jgi:hypothetical protein